MNKKIKFLAPALCGILLGSNLAITNVQAAPAQNNNNSKNILSARHRDKNYDCKAKLQGSEDITFSMHSASNSDTSSHIYAVAIEFFDADGNKIDYLHCRYKPSTQGIEDTLGSNRNWTYAKVYFYADSNQIDKTTVWRD